MDRLLLTLGTAAVAAVVYALMLKGWRSRLGRQADLPAPAAATGTPAPLLEAEPGLFVGTTGAGHWLDRIAVHHLSDRAAGSLLVASDGVHVERDGLPELFVPYASVRSVDVESALGGKVVSSGMLMLTWELGDRLLRTAFRATDREAHARLRDAIAVQVTA